MLMSEVKLDKEAPACLVFFVPLSHLASLFSTVGEAAKPVYVGWGESRSTPAASSIDIMCSAPDRWPTKEVSWRVSGSLLTQVHHRRRSYIAPLPAKKQAKI